MPSLAIIGPQIKEKQRGHNVINTSRDLQLYQSAVLTLFRLGSPNVPPAPPASMVPEKTPARIGLKVN